MNAEENPDLDPRLSVSGFLSYLLECSFVLLEFLSGFAEFALRGETLVILKLLDGTVHELL